MKTTKESTPFAGQGLAQLMLQVGLPQTETNNDRGIFKGKIVSAKTGARVFGVVIELVGTGHTYISSPTGYFKMTEIPEGMYLAKFSFPGFVEVTEVVAILNDEPLDMTLSLDVVS